ncbi:YfiR family protein [Mitsuaria sp. GD03876]|uniref:YfiR family protein n=1 Tax=Mitsuaria sp. GD03876 TaxID=2975399 RepID=UPI00244C61C7|nr:YfiR family protein [Mitsuaria sp. GD03876]MDH0863361.1 YfiR family protein [Mitsuaria sp. GD03876]
MPMPMPMPMPPMSMHASARGRPGRGRAWRAFAALWLLLGGLVAAQPAAAQAAGPDALKAEVVYRALMFVTWPAEREAGRTLQLCLAGESRLGTAMLALAGRSIRQLAIEPRRVTRPEQLAGCHLLYLPEEQPAWHAALEQPTLLVLSDAAGMLDHGAMLNLGVEDGRIVFDVDLDAARRAGLAISAKLLRLARYVRHQSSSP